MDMQDCYAWVVALSLVAFLLGYLIRLGDREDDLKHQKHYMSGVVLVEYSHEGKPIKCFVQQDGTYTTNNPVRTIIIASRYDDALIAKTAKMLDWDESVQKCERFHYEEDDKWRNFK